MYQYRYTALCRHDRFGECVVCADDLDEIKGKVTRLKETGHHKGDDIVLFDGQHIVSVWRSVQWEDV